MMFRGSMISRHWMLAAVQHNESDIMNLGNPAQNAEYTPSCDAVTMPTPDSMISGIEDAT